MGKARGNFGRVSRFCLLLHSRDGGAFEEQDDNCEGKAVPGYQHYARMRTHAATKDGESSIRWVRVGVQINSILQRPVLTTLFPLGFCLLPHSSPHPLISAFLSSRPNLSEVPHYLHLGQRVREASTGEPDTFAL